MGQALIGGKARGVLQRAVALIVVLQMVLAGLITFAFVSPELHIIFGFVVLGLAMVIMAVALIRRPPLRRLRGLSVCLVGLIIVEIFLGFARLDSGGLGFAWAHLLNAVVTYGIVVSGAFMALGEDRIRAGTSSP